MGSMKVWDGTAWQTAAQQGPPALGGLPPGGVTGAALVKRTAADYDAQWVLSEPNWTAYTPVLCSEGNVPGTGMTPGTGGYVYGAYRMIAPYTMAIRQRLQWGSNGGVGGDGGYMLTMPVGYNSDAGGAIQGLNGLAYANGFNYVGFVYVLASSIHVRLLAPNAALIQDWVGSQQVCRSYPPMHPPLWYPNGIYQTWGIIHTQQKW